MRPPPRPDPGLPYLIRAVLQRRDLTQRDLAALIHVHEATISLYLSGRRSPSAEHRAAIANLLDDGPVR
jgi:transcriptional regulator with XRE-family HTH domain